MPGATRRKNLRPRRRRPEEEGEDEGSVAGDLNDFSMSEGSAISNMDDDADGEGSEVSAEEDDASVHAAGSRRQAAAVRDAASAAHNKSGVAKQPAKFTVSADTNAMLNGLKASDASNQEVLRFDHAQEGSPTGPGSEVALGQAETPAQRSGREHLEYVKARDSNPAFVPTRGGFFLHDDRTQAAGAPFNRPFQRGRGRGYGPGYSAGRGFMGTNGTSERPWAHDLHETVNKSTGGGGSAIAAAATPSVIRPAPASSQIPTAKAAAIPPNRTFSVTTVLGNVTVQMVMPDVITQKTFSNVVKRQYTLLPQHRPPLRRDKPVRISIPEEQPRYIFPSTERSFIFIPRALRPNQQPYPRGRGRGSIHGSRRPSLLGGSVHTPSVGMSRRSSISAVATSGLHTPTDSLMRGPMFTQNIPRAVVRMPTAAVPMPMPPPSYIIPAPMHIGNATPPEHGAPGPAILQSPQTSIPMHQPRPQKTVSVAGIELPALKPPQQQQEQPFHQQMPPGVNLQGSQSHSSQSGAAGNTPLSHIPEGAVYAQPFQPYPMYPASNYYNMPYAAGAMFYPPTSDSINYGMNMGGPVMAPQFVPTSQPVPYGNANPGLVGGQPGPVAHESNGMVFYYDPSQYAVEGSMGQYPANGMMGTSQYFYPSMPQNVFYPPPNGQ